MPVVPADVPNLRRAADILRNGGVVAFPTETVYGLGADAWDKVACARVFEIKRRPHFDPLIVHVASVEGLSGICGDLDARSRLLAAAFWPGPLTLVVRKTDLVPGIVTAGLATVAVRVPSHPVARALLKMCGRPIAAPSANPFGYISPTLASHVASQIGDDVDLVLDGGPTTHGVESTILDVSSDRALLLRPGAIEIERIEEIVGKVELPALGAPLRAPGQLASHYAPRKPLTIVEHVVSAAPGAAVGLLAFGVPDAQIAASYATVEVLSRTYDVREAASNLFSCLHRLDAAEIDSIVAETVPSAGLGAAILDRLLRASARSH